MTSLRVTFLHLIMTLFLSCSLVQTSRHIQRSVASAQKSDCRESLKSFLDGARFLHKDNSSLHQGRRVVEASAQVSGVNRPAYKIAYWLSKLEGRLLSASGKSGLRDIETIKRFYRLNNIIKKEDVPESYFDGQRRIAREQGHGDIVITKEMRLESINNIRSDQRHSLDIWMDYFLSQDSRQYPVWVKYWSFEGMLKLGTFDEEAGKFSKRTSSTVAPFAELNREAFAEVVDTLVKKAKGDSLEDLTDATFKNLIASGASFGRLYGRQLKILKEKGADSLAQTQGRWVKYDQGSSADELVASLKGKGTGWCTAGHSTAQSQLEEGDFYVYYSKDQDGNMSNPRLAIRMNGDRIEEVRGVAFEQNLDEHIAGTDILDNKLKEFGEQGQHYKKRSADMKRLTDIEKRSHRGEDLGEEDLRFIYELDQKIEGFGYEKDPRIKEIIAKRNIRSDISRLTGYKESEISLTENEAFRGGIKYHYGDLTLHSSMLQKELKFPEHVQGSLNLSILESAKGVTLPKSVGGTLNLWGLKSAKGLKLPEHIGDYLDLGYLESAQDLKLPKVMKGGVGLGSLKSTDGLKLPERIEGNLNLNSLVSARGLVLPRYIGGSLHLANLKSAEGLVLPDYLGGDLSLFSLTSAAGLKINDHLKGYLNLSSLESAKGLILPRRIEGGLKLGSLTSAIGLRLPSYVGGDLSLDLLTSTDGLILPDFIGGYLTFRSLKFLNSSVIPQGIDRSKIESNIRIP